MPRASPRMVASPLKTISVAGSLSLPKRLRSFRRSTRRRSKLLLRSCNGATNAREGRVALSSYAPEIAPHTPLSGGGALVNATLLCAKRWVSSESPPCTKPPSLAQVGAPGERLRPAHCCQHRQAADARAAADKRGVTRSQPHVHDVSGPPCRLVLQLRTYRCNADDDATGHKRL
jgi:hypothetical protein